MGPVQALRRDGENELPDAAPASEAPVPETRAPATPPAPAPVAVTAAPARKKRGYLRAVLMLGGIAAAIGGGGFAWLRGGRFVSTDKAYVRAAKLMVATDVSGLVVSVDVKEGERVAAGQVLFRVDPRQFEIALRMAEAQLAQVRITLEAAQQAVGGVNRALSRRRVALQQ